MIISRTPFRISFFGGGTDYPSWYRRYGGQVLATTIDKYCYLSCRYLPPFFEHSIRVIYSQIENCQSIEQVKHPAVRGILKYLRVQRGVEIHHDADLPARSGLGSSSAFTVGLLHAVHALQGRMVHKQRLAEESIHIEQNMLKEVVGCQDQTLAAYGGFNHLVFQKNGETSIHPVTLPADTMSALNQHLMLFYSGIKRTASKVAGSYVTGLDRQEKKLHRMAEMVREGLDILSHGKDLRAFGELLHETWQLKRTLSEHITNDDVDDIYRRALSAGAVGGKLIGAGGGGFFILFVDPDRRQRVRETLSRLIHVPFRFETHGSQIIFYTPETDYRDQEMERVHQPIRAFRELECPDEC